MPAMFFRDERDYAAWIQTVPGIMRVLGGDDEEVAQGVDGPYYYGPRCLILRDAGYYCAIERVDRRDEADFTWYLGTPDGGEDVFAAIIWDRRQDPPVKVGAMTIQEARTVIGAFLITRSGGRFTIPLWPASTGRL